MQLAAEKIWEKAPVELSIVEKKVPSLAPSGCAASQSLRHFVPAPFTQGNRNIVEKKVPSKARLDASLCLITVTIAFGRAEEFVLII